MANNKSRERELAAQLFINSNMSQKEIAENLGVSEKSIADWKERDNWDSLKEANQTSDQQAIADMRYILNKLLARKKKAMEEDDDTFSKNDADAILELSRAIDTLKGGVPLKVRVSVMEEFMDSIPNDNPIRKELVDFQMKYLLGKR